MTGQLARLRQVIAAILALAGELAGGTIERVLAKDDAELGLEYLLSGQGRLSDARCGAASGTAAVVRQVSSPLLDVISHEPL